MVNDPINIRYYGGIMEINDNQATLEESAGDIICYYFIMFFFHKSVKEVQGGFIKLP